MYDNVHYADITLSVDTSAYADGDVLAATQEIANVVEQQGGLAELVSIALVDPDDQGVALDLVFFGSNTAIGAEQSAPDIDDTEALQLLGVVHFVAGDYVDLGGAQVATLADVGLMMKAAAGGTSLYVAAITRGAPTYAGGALKLRLGFRTF